MLVLLHGQPGSAADWQQVTRRLPVPLRTVAIDRPGYGASPLPPAGFAANAGAVLSELDSRGIQRAVLVGHSYGGGVALAAASLALDRFLRTDPRDVGCAEAIEMLAVYVDLVVAGRPAEQRSTRGSPRTCVRAARAVRTSTRC